MYISSAWSFFNSCLASNSNSAFTFLITSYLSIVNSLASMSLDMSGSTGFLSNIIEFFRGDDSRSTIIFSFAPGIKLWFLFFALVLNSITIF